MEEKEIGKETKEIEGEGKRERQDGKGSERGRVKEEKCEEVDKVAMDAPRDDNSEFPDLRRDGRNMDSHERSDYEGQRTQRSGKDPEHLEWK